MSTFTTDSLLTCSRYSANPGYQRFAFSTETQKTRCEMIVMTTRLSSKAGHVRTTFGSANQSLSSYLSIQKFEVCQIFKKMNSVFLVRM